MMPVEDAGGIEAQLRLDLTQMERDALEAQKKMDALAAELKAKGATAGDGLADGIKSGSTKWDSSIKTMKANLSSLGPWGTSVGNKLATGLSKPVIAAVPKMAMAFRSLQAAMGPIMIVIGLVTSAIVAIKGFLDKQNQAAKEAKEKQEAFNKTVKDTEDNYRRLAIAAGGLNQNVSVQVQLIGSGTGALQRQAEAQARINALLENAANKMESIVVKYASGREISTAELVNQLNILAIMSSRVATLRTELAAARAIGDENKIAAAQAALEAQRTGTALNSRKSELEVQKARLDVLREVWLGLAAEKGLNDSATSAAQMAYFYAVQELERKQRAVELAEEQLRTAAQFQTIEEEIAAAQEKYNEALRLANELKAASIAAGQDVAEAEAKANDDRFRASQNLSSALTQIKDKYDVESEQLENLIAEEQARVAAVEQTRRAEEAIAKAKENQRRIDAILIDQGDTLKQQEIASWKAKAAAAETDGERNAALEEAIRLEIELINIQRERAWQAIKGSDEYIAASIEEQEEIRNNFIRITAGMIKVVDEVGEVGEGGSFLEKLFGTDKFSQIMQIGEAAIDAFDGISNAALDIARQHAEELIAVIEETLEKTLKDIEDARKKSLIAAGFAVADSVESLEAQLEHAKKTGDEILIYLAQRRLEEQRINDEFDEQARQAEEEAKKEKAKIEYDLAIQEYRNKMINAVNTGIMAVINALASPVPWPIAVTFGAAAGIASNTQIALLAANPPKPPKFANSGIVPGNNYFGDRNIAAVDSGELILNRAHQDNVANQLTSNSHVEATIIFMIDTREIAKSTVELVNDGFFTIKARAIR